MKYEWIGVMSVTYNVEDNGVKAELWVDDCDEENNWEKVEEYIPTRATLKSIEMATATEMRTMS